MNLKPCPACENPDPRLNDGVTDALQWVGCGHYPDCAMIGPQGDTDGSKWDAMPRRFGWRFRRWWRQRRAK